MKPPSSAFLLSLIFFFKPPPPHQPPPPFEDEGGHVERMEGDAGPLAAPPCRRRATPLQRIPMQGRAHPRRAHEDGGASLRSVAAAETLAGEHGISHAATPGTAPSAACSNWTAMLINSSACAMKRRRPQPLQCLHNASKKNSGGRTDGGP